MCVVTTVTSRFVNRQEFICRAIVDEIAKGQPFKYGMTPVSMFALVEIKRMIEGGKISLVEVPDGCALSISAAILRLNQAGNHFLAVYNFIPTLKEIVLGIMKSLSELKIAILVPNDAFIKKYLPPPPSRGWRI